MMKKLFGRFIDVPRRRETAGRYGYFKSCSTKASWPRCVIR